MAVNLKLSWPVKSKDDEGSKAVVKRGHDMIAAREHYLHCPPCLRYDSR
jgi:hypothetical protein